ncbi:DnaJ protein, putative [Plasmodium knowlesi strain H]|uniref:DnaJ protein, putative n=3 Tax=Plasmodium knowlesi TaxID=5850 RepID=A0A5K1UXM2_PLAKH|nr:DnaJ protein, putative [Plasmodium knowlesi strain H]OTN64318.1 putative DnaJ protein [Plasmodium knowlesi]CAA9989120.1 DnaJ protein, putative [Plasmodium knowlesi strain H]SBO27336.1 DnaJ protein, putative [Plasmodium knowlesi strain H]SBO28959.1 DnaJ protein, putative [Plasmodium knowlesi strain H]VVS78594.1 DnaJ protein, putative [Plasmodium knowlesi strain H]|eukprot:XP_002261467.1 hypothetical protein, conserved in Plasmodium species [Plasmodium knowlesi strain H]
MELVTWEDQVNGGEMESFRELSTRKEESIRSRSDRSEGAEAYGNTLWNISSMNSENKKYFLQNYVEKIKRISQYSVKPMYYDILSVRSNADGKTIRRSYLQLSKLFSVHKKLSREHEECYHCIQKAYQMLNDKFEKFYYDVLNGYIHESTIEECRRQLQMEAEVIYRNKINEVKSIYLEKLQKEERKNGLIIEKALFGNLTLKEEHINNCLNMDVITENDLEGPFLDLTTILQARIENSSFMFNDEFSFAHFCGIPKPLIKIPCRKDVSYADILQSTEMYLYIKYKFLNTDHELIVVDRSRFTLPQSTHRIFGNRICGPFSPVNVIKMKHLSNSLLDTIFHFFSKNKFYITLLTTILLCAQSVKSA